MTTWSEAEQAGRIAGATLTDKKLRLRTVPCACGGEITADAADPGPEVRRHNHTVNHRIWWIKNEPDWQGEEADLLLVRAGGGER